MWVGPGWWALGGGAHCLIVPPCQAYRQPVPKFYTLCMQERDGFAAWRAGEKNGLIVQQRSFFYVHTCVIPAPIVPALLIPEQHVLSCSYYNYLNFLLPKYIMQCFWLCTLGNWPHTLGNGPHSSGHILKVTVPMWVGSLREGGYQRAQEKNCSINRAGNRQGRQRDKPWLWW